MYNYKITRIGYLAPCLAGFCAVLFLTVFCGIFVALWDHDLSCIVSSACFGLLFGLVGCALIFLAIFLFNLFIPITKGISLQLSVMDIPHNTPADAQQVKHN